MNRRWTTLILAALAALTAGAEPGGDLKQAKSYQSSGDCAAAVPLLRQAAARKSEAAEAQLLLGLCYEKLGRPTDAARCYQQVGDDRRFGAEAKYYAAQLCLTDQRFEEAARLFQSVGDKHPGSKWAAPAMERAGWCWQRAGRRRLAYEAYQRALGMTARPELRDDIRKRIREMGYYVE